MKAMHGLYYPNRRTWLGAALALTALPAWHVRASTMDARAAVAGNTLLSWVRESLAAIGRPRWLLLGEQHDADAHQALQAAVVQVLAEQGRLAALVLEMAERGQNTRALAPNAPQAAVQAALQWNDRGWPWRRYGPVVMTAVRAGVPVLG
ncbi:MAG: ChaN family lipoprotein, partial [Tepidimonas ignava]